MAPLSQLRHLDISGCKKLAAIEANAFRGCLDLKHVSISINRALVYLDPQAFDPAMSKLQNLDLGELYESFDRKRPLVKYQSQSEVIKFML